MSLDVKLDRREILGLLRPHIPTLPEDITSDDLHAFLDAQTGLTTAIDEPNGSAFDKWRMALAAQDYPVWGHSAEKKAEVLARGEFLKAEEAKRKAAHAALLVELAKEAPGKPIVNP